MTTAPTPRAGMLPPAGWTLIVPVKSTSRGKSRIDVDPQLRQRIARALAVDTVTAAAASAAVTQLLVVADEQVDAAELATIAGVRVQLTATRSLNAAIAEGVAAATGMVAVLPADLPGVTAAELDAVLQQAASMLIGDDQHSMAVIADRQGVGTTLLAALDPSELHPHYGSQSFRRHQDAGAKALDVAAESWIRRDIDTLADLASITTGRTGELAAQALGLRPSCVGGAC
ncbi:MAG: 2-phospho-L-lactate guanylyltransferase [Actinomycetota bacterium]|nr:2-phospho-L-lactate guanylyltransferase [Actinomycetota bacterium]